MDFAISPRAEDLRAQLQAFIDERVAPAAPVYIEQVRESGDPHFHPPVMEELKSEARARGLWNLFLPNPKWGAGLTNLDYAPLCELCLLYTSDAADDLLCVDLGGRRIIK